MDIALKPLPLLVEDFHDAYKAADISTRAVARSDTVTVVAGSRADV
jgi:hypothetical protein